VKKDEEVVMAAAQVRAGDWRLETGDWRLETEADVYDKH